MNRNENTIPKILNTVVALDDDNKRIRYDNMIVCMFASPVLIIGAFANFLVRHFIFHRPLEAMILDSAVLLVLGVIFEIFLRANLKIGERVKSYCIAALLALFFLYVMFKYYTLIGPAIWIFGMILVMLAVVQNTRILFSFSCVALLIAWVYITFFAEKLTVIPKYYYHLQFSFFAILYFASLTVHKISTKRVEQMKSQYAHLKAINKLNEQLAHFDQLTGLPNRVLAHKLLAQVLREAERNAKEPCVLLIGLDRFKQINDSLGHAAGDAVLIEAAGRIAQCTYGARVVSRYSGDEFLVVMSGATEQEVLNVANCLLRKITLPFTLDDRKLHLTCSIGVSRFPVDGDCADILVRHADVAMNRAKEEGRNTCRVYSQKLDHQLTYEMNLTSELRSALNGREFELYYQPQVDDAKGTIVGFEALLRWNHPVRGMISPAEFIPLADKSQMILPIGEWVLRTACRQTREWQNRGFPCVPVSVNISIIQICCGSLPQTVRSILEETELEPRYLILEITEKVLAQDMERIVYELNLLKSIGVRVAIDDFGTGYSSLRYLKMMPIEFIKIPLEFVRDIGKSEKDESIITVILALSNILSIEVVAEGVETQEQLDFLRGYGCRIIQGYYFYRPMKAIDIEALRK